MKKAIAKGVFLIIVLVVLILANKTVSPVITNDVAVQNLNGGNIEFCQLGLWDSMKNFIPVAYIILVILTFAKEINKTIKKIKEKFKNEK